jgi:hypothetical protein
MLRLEPGAEGERGQAERRPGQRLRRAQRLHPGEGHPGTLPPRFRPVQHPDIVDAHQPQLRRRRQPAHPRADDDIGHALALRHPGLRRQFQEFEVLAEPRLQRGQSAGGIEEHAAMQHNPAQPCRADGTSWPK